MANRLHTDDRILVLPDHLGPSDLVTLLRASSHGWHISRPGVGWWAAERRYRDAGHDTLRYIVAVNAHDLAAALRKAGASCEDPAVTAS
jgi:hypothetical protein